MSGARRPRADMETVLGYLLLVGVILSSALVAAGLIWRWIRTAHLGMDYTLDRTNLFAFLSSELRLLAAGAARPRVLVSLGIAVLLLTPYLRVVTSLVFFLFRERNWKYAALTGFVLAVLTYSLLF